MSRSRALRPVLEEELESRSLPSTTNPFPVSNYVSLNHFHNGLGHVSQGSIISLNQAFHEGFHFGWGQQQLDPGTVLISAGSHEHNPRLFLMKANTLTVWEYRLDYPFQRIFTSRDLADGSLARFARQNQWPWAKLLGERVTVVPSKGLELSGTVSGPFAYSDGQSSIGVGRGPRDPLAGSQSAKSFVYGLVNPLGPVHVAGTLAAPTTIGGTVPNGNLVVRSPAGWVRLAVSGPSQSSASTNSAFVDTFTIAKASGTLRFAKGSARSTSRSIRTRTRPEGRLH